ncbi:MAG: DUF4139 domain-containing protein [Saprospiraceae bacterium]|nr:DUF4139 domain-containing protein [Saprospiraceae bacterium]
MRIFMINLLLCGWAVTLRAGGPAVSPKISEVTVYRSGAKVSSTATVKVPAGASEVVFENLSPYFNGSSLQVKIKGDARLNSAVFQLKTPGPGPEDPRAQVLRDSLLLLGDNIVRLNNEREVLKEEIDMIRKNQQRVSTYLPGQNGSTTLSVSELRELTAYYIQRLGLVKERNLQLDIQQRWFNKLLERMNQDLLLLQPNTANQTGEIVLKLDATTAQSLDITCTYLVLNAGWTPLYDLRSAGQDKPLQLVYKANVHNSSGFDWKSVLLHLSTAQPLANNNRPILNPVFVDFRTVAVYRDQVLSAPSTTNMYQLKQLETEDIARAADEVVAPEFGAGGEPLGAVGDDNFITTFDLSAPQTVLANGQDNIVTVDERELPAEYEYHAVPKVESAVFLLAKLTDYGQYNLLPGTANIFFEDTYVGQTWVDPNITADTLLLSLGRDEQISIKRVQPKDFKERRKVFNSKIRESYAFEISIKNNKNKAIIVDLLDQIPVSRQKDIVVTLDDKDGAEYLEDFGKLEWKIEVPPGKNKKVRFKYSIEYPKDKAIGTFRG